MIYTVELVTPKLDHTVTIDVEAKSFGGAEKAAREEYYWAKPVVVKAVRLNDTPNASYSDRVVYVPLTGSLKNDLSCYLLMTTKYREREREAWEDLGYVTEADGSPKFPNAASNASFWSDMIGKVDTVIKILDNV